MISPLPFKPFFLSAIGLLGLLLSLGSMANAQHSGVAQTLTTATGDDIVFEVFKSPGPDIRLRVLWIAPGFGIDIRHQQTATALASQGVEVWLVDLTEALFLTKGASSLRKIPGQLVADLINGLIEHDGDRAEVLVISSSYGAIPAIRGIHAWQSQTPKPTGLLGSVLYSPSFFSQVPELGLEPEFIPELAASNMPMYIFQAANNANRWHLPAVLEELKNAVVYAELLKDVMSVFYRKDTSPNTLQSFENAPAMILRAAQQLRQHGAPPAALPLATTKSTPRSGLNTQLRPYAGIVEPGPIHLRDASERLFDIKDYQGRVTVINFWASWCPPCVEEIPSLNRLKQAMQGKPFELISVNYAETAETIRDFLQQVDVDFPVLLDPGGQLTGQWKVVAFPSTFVIGTDGKIRYGVNAGIHWDTPQVIQQINELLP
ncbi:MAG: TlpA disulfide reductase family protein [Gammaproteobacteria bacterium]|nr:TlpA disulfide reductase family protein [Gammaproteobacteria bacterium]